ncbi:C4-dicarboxylate transport protein [Paraburkholderia ultramafica]|uniref:C4-dicarboxylate transport protein n=1 Tax=Paraburkholderia ultramafica TaxID=1544867 RepID=A0A6S7B0J4_9BURK|nr:C4-dicarboxylate transport protein [Paraburkholderia ultramafica]
MTNLIGNGVATIVVARWEGALDMNQARAVLNRESASNGIDALRPVGQETQERPASAKETLIRSGTH